QLSRHNHEDLFRILGDSADHEVIGAGRAGDPWNIAVYYIIIAVLSSDHGRRRVLSRRRKLGNADGNEMLAGGQVGRQFATKALSLRVSISGRQAASRGRRKNAVVRHAPARDS